MSPRPPRSGHAYASNTYDNRILYYLTFYHILIEKKRSILWFKYVWLLIKNMYFITFLIVE